MSRGFRDAAELLAFRMLPVGPFLLIARAGWRARTLIGALCVAALVAPGRERALSTLALLYPYAYFTGATFALPWLCRELRAGRITKGFVFTAWAFIAFLVPSVFVPEWQRAPVTLLAWEILLSGYSYCTYMSARERASDARDRIFFVLVNPALVYADRGETVGPPSLSTSGLLRILVGFVQVASATALFEPMIQRLQVSSPAHPLVWSVGSAALGAALFAQTYARHSGLASIQIGLTRQFGVRVPERYDWPILARNPLDFWRRWNT
jgi:hypothetical protein